MIKIGFGVVCAGLVVWALATQRFDTMEGCLDIGKLSQETCVALINYLEAQ